MGNHICKDDITPARLNYLIYVNIRNPELCKQQLIFVCGIFESKLVLEFTLCLVRCLHGVLLPPGHLRADLLHAAGHHIARHGEEARRQN